MRYFGEEPHRQGQEVGVEQGPREEGEVGPDVEHLRQVDRGDVVVFVAEDDPTVPYDEGGECGQEREVGG